MKYKLFRFAGLLAAAVFLPLRLSAQTAEQNIAEALCADYDEAAGKALIASTSSDQSSLLARAIVLHNLAYYYGKVYLPDAQKSLSQLEEIPLAQAYKGSAMTMAGRFALDAKDIVTAAEQTQKGISVLAEAVKKDSSNPWIRYLRLLNGVEVSRLSPFKQYEVISSDADFLFLLATASGPEFRSKTGIDADSVLGKKFRCAIYFQLAEYSFDMKKIAKALEYWDKAWRLSPSSRYGKEAAKKLAQLED